MLKTKDLVKNQVFQSGQWEDRTPDILGVNQTLVPAELTAQKKAGDYLLSRNESSIIDVRELDFRVRNGNGYYLSTMATGIINNAVYEVRKFHEGSTQDGI